MKSVGPRMDTLAATTEFILEGHSRTDIVKWLEGQGIQRRNAYLIYYQALEELMPDESLIDNEKRYLIQQNLDRLESIINSSINGNTGDKKVALQAISELNKMLGIYESNKVTIANNKEGEQIVQITFDK